MPLDQSPPPGVAVNLHETLSLALNSGMRTEATRRGLPELDWTLQRHGAPILGHAGRGDYAEVQVPDVLAAWATAFNLAPQEPSMPGTIEYYGHSYGLTIELWGVADRDAFDRAAQTSHGG